MEEEEPRELIIVPETHWDREWYLTFQEYRAKLVILVDRLLEILDSDPEFRNFTFDGQTIVLEDYLEVRPGEKEKLQGYVAEERISVGPWYVLPDEFLVSGEALIRNLMIGHQIARKFGRVMKAGYIPDPFGHVAQLPQVLAGFGINSCLFMRGFGNEFEDFDLDMDFLWEAPGAAASVLGVHLIAGYGSVAHLSTERDADGRFTVALDRIAKTSETLAQHAATNTILLNNGSDHLMAQPELPEIIRQWNEAHPRQSLVNDDFEAYVRKVIAKLPKLKPFVGELRGGRYSPLLSGVFSARMWIKQANFRCQQTLEKYAEPAATLAWLVAPKYKYPAEYLWLGWRWLIKNHPHDSICGCSIDEVHEEMRTRFAWAQGIADETFKDALVAIARQMRIRPGAGDEFLELLVFNPHPWSVTAPAAFDLVINGNQQVLCPEDFCLQDPAGAVVPMQNYWIEERPRYQQVGSDTYRFTFVARDLPALGLKRYYLYPAETAPPLEDPPVSISPEGTILENEFYIVSIDETGAFSLHEKVTRRKWSQLGVLVDEGDWGDEYDFSGPREPRGEVQTTVKSFEVVKAKVTPGFQGDTVVSTSVEYTLELPASLDKSREHRTNTRVECPVRLEITLHAGVKRVDLRYVVENRARDHRLRAWFPTSITANHVNVDGHFMVVDRPVQLPDDEGWTQRAQPTNHQHGFVNVQEEEGGFAVFNRGLPEYEAIQDASGISPSVETPPGALTIAVTLLRCVGWLSRGDIATRPGNAGPDLHTPGAQCLGCHTFDLALTTHAGDWLEAGLHRRALEYSSPPKVCRPQSVTSRTRALDKVYMSGISILQGEREKNAARLPEAFSAMELAGDELGVTAVKRSEDGTGAIIRVVNYASQEARGIISFPFKPAAAFFVDLNEEDSEIVQSLKANMEVVDDRINLAWGPHVIATIKVLFPI